jgi:hypothetical protein
VPASVFHVYSLSVVSRVSVVVLRVWCSGFVLSALICVGIMLALFSVTRRPRPTARWLIVMPIDTVKTRIQAEVMTDRVPRIADVVRELWQRDGAKGFLRGLSE